LYNDYNHDNYDHHNYNNNYDYHNDNYIYYNSGAVWKLYIYMQSHQSALDMRRRLLRLYWRW
jgi:hypothetical protein